jgi:hypothetical protein
MVRLFNTYGFRWGGEYDYVKDWMHFEFMGTPRQARRMRRRVRRDFPSAWAKAAA